MRSLRALLFASLAVPLILFAGFAAQSRQRELDAAAESVHATTALLNEHAEKVLETHQLVLDRIDEWLGGMDWPDIAASPSLHRKLVDLKQQHEQIDNIWIIDPGGMPRASSIAGQIPAVSLTDRDYFIELRDHNDGIAISRIYRGRITGNNAFNIARRRSAPDGHFDGVIAVSVKIDYFQSFYKALETRPDEVIALTRNDGALLVREPATGAQHIPPNAEALERLKSKDEDYYTSVSAVDGVDRITGYHRIDGFPVYVFRGISKNQALADWRRNTWLFGGITLLLSGFLAAITLVALHRVSREEIAVAALRREMERREQAESALRQSQKMEALGQLTGGVAHDFNNLLTVFAGNIELMDRTAHDSDRMKRLVEGMRKAVARGEALTRQLLSFSRRQSLQPEIFDLRERIDSLSDMLSRSIRQPIEIDLAPDLSSIELDPNEFELAILNMAVNARDAMPQGGKVRLAARNVSLPAPGETPLAEHELRGAFVAITLSDTGTGIPPEALDRIFEPFFTTKEPGKGTGLGLAQVYGFVHRSGGGIAVRSVIGEGTEFTLYLPCAAATIDKNSAARQRFA